MSIEAYIRENSELKQQLKRALAEGKEQEEEIRELVMAAADYERIERDNETLQLDLAEHSEFVQQQQQQIEVLNNQLVEYRTKSEALENALNASNDINTHNVLEKMGELSHDDAIQQLAEKTSLVHILQHNTDSVIRAQCSAEAVASTMRSHVLGDIVAESGRLERAIMSRLEAIRELEHARGALGELIESEEDEERQKHAIEAERDALIAQQSAYVEKSEYDKVVEALSKERAIVEDLKKNMNSTDQRAISLDDQIKDITLERDSLTSHVTDLQKRLDTSLSMQATLEKNLETVRNAEQDLRTECNSLKRELKEKEENVVSVTEHARQLEGMLQGSRAEIDRLMMSETKPEHGSEAEAESKGRHTSRVGSTGDRDGGDGDGEGGRRWKQRSISMSDEGIEQLRHERDAYQTDAASLRAELASSESRLQSERQLSIECEVRVKSLEAELGNMRTAAAEERQKAQTAADEYIESSRQREEALLARIAELEKVKEELSVERKECLEQLKLKAKEEEEREKVEEVDVETVAVEDRKQTNTTTGVRDEKEKEKEKEDDHVTPSTLNTNTNADHSQMEQTLSVANAKTASISAELNSLKAKYDALEEDLIACRNELESACDDLAYRSAALDTVTSELEAVQAELDNVNKDVVVERERADGAEAELMECKNDLEYRSIALDSVTTELETIRTEYTEAHGQIDTLQNGIIALKTKNDTLEGDFERAKDNWGKEKDLLSLKMEALELQARNEQSKSSSEAATTSTLVNELVAVKGELNTEIEKRKKLESELIECRNDLETALTRAEMVENELDQYESDHEEEKEKGKAREAEMKEIRGRESQYKMDMEQMQSHLNETMETLKNTQDALVEEKRRADEAIDALNEQLMSQLEGEGEGERVVVSHSPMFHHHFCRYRIQIQTQIGRTLLSSFSWRQRQSPLDQ